MTASKLLVSLLLSAGLTGCLVNHDLYEERFEALSDDDADGFNGDQGDCNDNDPHVFPGAAELCNDTDDDCDGYIDNITEGSFWYDDADGDGYGDIDTEVLLCEAPDEGWLSIGGDCDDADAAVNPDAEELCNLADDDCDGTIDNDPVDGAVWYFDQDKDGYGDESSPQVTCEDVTGLLTTGGDCDDTDDAVNPDAEEVCGDRVDNNCNGSADHCVWEAELDMREGLLIESDYELDTFAWGGCLADLNGDGETELLLSSYYAYVEDTDTRPGTIQSFELPITGSMTRLGASRFITGDNDTDGFGFQVVVADLDGDGAQDLLSGAYSSDPGGLYRAGAVYIFYGPLTGDASASDADWMIEGSVEDGWFGEVLEVIGDYNDDGRPDFIAGSFFYFPDYEGVRDPGLVRLYLDAGNGTEDDSTSSWLEVYGAEDSMQLGSSVLGVDADGDGLTELLLGADEGGGLYGGVYVFEDGHSGLLSTDDADALWLGEVYISYAGDSLDSPGDLNNDGIDDVLVGAPQAGDGTAYVVWGGDGLSLPTLADADIKIRGTRGGGRNFGGYVRGVGDLNDDGEVDILVGEGGVAPNDVYVYYGPFSAAGVLADTDADVVLTGDPDEDEDYNLAIGGEDLTGDGVPDLLVGSHQNDYPGGDEWAGTAYIIPGVGL